MTQYHFLDDSGDPGLEGQASSSSHFRVGDGATDRTRAIARFGVDAATASPSGELRVQVSQDYFRAEDALFPFCKVTPLSCSSSCRPQSGLPDKYLTLSGQELTVEFIVNLALRTSPLDIADDILVIDAAKRAFLWRLRVRLSQECRRLKRVRSFRTIVGGDSSRDDGLQLTDMIVGATRQHVMGIESSHYRTFADKVIDLWKVGG